MRKIRWGIVGAGDIANTFARDMLFVANAEVSAVAARALGSAADFAAKHGIPKALQGYDKLFADRDIDAVYIATPHTLHLTNSSDALRAGKAVLCEKPITVSAAECRTLIEIARKADHFLMEAMWTWFLPAVRKARDWVQQGRIGELRHIKADFGYPIAYAPDSRRYDTALGGGCLLEMGIYPIAIARYFTGQAPNDISVICRHAPNGAEDDVVMLLDYDSLAATLATSYRCKLQNHAYIIGTDAYITIPDFWRARECQLYVLEERVDRFEDERSGSGFEFQIEAVSNDILLGRKQSATVTHADSLAFQHDMDRVRACF